MEFHPLKRAKERKIEARITDVASHVGASAITYCACESIGDLPVFVGKVPRGLAPEEFVERVAAKVYQTIGDRAPQYRGRLRVNAEQTHAASTERVRYGEFNENWGPPRLKPEGVTIVLTPTHSEQLLVV